MIIIQSKGRSISFVVEGYQFPEKTSPENDFDYDANWLEIEFTYTDEDGSRRYNDACLLTNELEGCIEEINKIITGEESLYISDFMEPYLKVVIAKADDVIIFGLQFVYDTTGGIWKTHKLSEMMSEKQLQKIVDEMKVMALRFPRR